MLRLVAVIFWAIGLLLCITIYGLVLGVFFLICGTLIWRVSGSVASLLEVSRSTEGPAVQAKPTRRMR